MKELKTDFTDAELRAAGVQPPKPFDADVSLDVEHGRIELRTYRGDVILEWLEGLPADCGLLRDRESGKIIGVNLPTDAKNIKGEKR